MKTEIKIAPIRYTIVPLNKKIDTILKPSLLQFNIDIQVVINTGRYITDPSVKKIVVYKRACFILKNDGTVWVFGYNDNKIFSDINKVDYEDTYIKIEGKLIKNNLFEINDSETIVKKIIQPSLQLYRKH